MVAYTYSRVAALNFNTTPPTVARSATGSVYAVADTTFTTPLTVTMVVGGSTTTTISSDANGFFPDFTVNDRTSVVWKQASSSFTTVLTTSDPVPGPQGAAGTPGAQGVKGDRGDLATWQASTFYPLSQVIANPSGDLVKVTTAHTSGGSYDATKFGWVNNNAANLTGTLPEASLPSRLAEASLNATIGTEVSTAGHAAHDALSGIFTGQRSLIYHDPINKADGAISAGNVLDSGQQVVNNFGTNPLRYSGGQIVHTAGSTVGVANAGYLQTQVTSDRVRRMFSKAAWPANALGAVAFVVPSAQWSNGVLPVAGFHSTHYGNGIWTCGVWNPAAGQTGHVEAHRLDINSGTSVTLQVTTTTPASTQTTAALTISTMTATSLKTALEGLSNVGAGKVTVVGPFAGKYGIVWASSLGAVTMTVSASAGTPAPTVTLYQGTGGTSGGVTTYASNTTHGRYATVWDGTLKDLDVWLSPETAQGIIFFPDGTNSGYFTDPGINLWTSTFAILEQFENNTSAIDTPAVYGKFSVDNFHTHPDTPALTKPELVTQLSSLAPQTLYDGGNTTGADLSVGGSIPPGTKYIEVTAIGGTGGGGSGACTPSGTAANGGGAAGSAGIIERIIPQSAIGSTWAGVVGRKGTGGVPVSTTGNGNAGTAGTLTKFSTASAGGAVLAAFQALAGGGGDGGKSGGTASAAGGAGGPFATAGSASGINGAVGNNGINLTSNLGTPGSASGGGITATPTANNGGVGGSNLVRGYTGGTAGVTGGAAPGPGTDIVGATLTAPVAGVPGPGVGGGAASITGAAQAGVTPVMYGVGGSGGGASLNGNASGAGGDGIGGYLLVRAHFQ